MLLPQALISLQRVEYLLNTVKYGPVGTPRISREEVSDRNIEMWGHNLSNLVHALGILLKYVSVVIVLFSQSVLTSSSSPSSHFMMLMVVVSLSLSLSLSLLCCIINASSISNSPPTEIDQCVRPYAFCECDYTCH